MVYVSCNPHGYRLRNDFVLRGGSLAASAKLLCEPRGRTAPFRLSAAAPVDLFPSTTHCELVLVFDRVERAATSRGPRRARRTDGGASEQVTPGVAG